MFETWYKMASLLQAGLDVSAVITHALRVDAYEEGFELMRSGQSCKVLLDWSR
jgi:threonine 3-dehydrogenase